MNVAMHNCERLDLVRCELQADPKSGASCEQIQSQERAASRSKVRCELREEPQSDANCELKLKSMQYL